MKQFFLFACMALMCSCATIISGHKQMVTFSTYPAQATVIVDGKELGVTPLTLKVKRTTSSVRFQKEGYEPAEYSLHRKFNGWFLGNILLGGPLGMVIDLINGSYVNTDNNVYKELKKN